MTKTSLVVPGLLAATLFASLPSCKKKSDSSPATHVASFTDSVVVTSGSTTMTYFVSSFNLSYSDNKLSMMKGFSKDYQSGSVSYDSTTRMYSYVDGKCIITQTDDPKVDTVYLDGDKITQVNSSAVTFHDGTNKVKSFRNDQYTWTGDNLTSKVNSSGDSITFTYNTSKDASIANPITLGDYLEFGHLLYNSKNLISSSRQGNSAGGQDISYEYTFDGSGRITNIVETNVGYGSSASSSTMKIYYSFSY